MAKAKNPLFSQEAHGALGGIMFRTGTYGQVVSRRSITAVGRSQSQCTARGRLKKAHTLWQSLTDADRSAWSAYATPPETGANAYIRQATISMMCGITPLTRPGSGTASLKRLNFLITSATRSTARLRLEIQSDLTSGVRLIYKVLATYSKRKDPNMANFTFAHYGSTVDERVDLYLKCPAPRVHLIVETMHTASRTITQRKHFLFKPNWI